MKSLSILLIDDDVQFRDGLARFLEGAGHGVTCASTARHGIALIAREVFDVIVTDMLIGEEDGIEVVKTARVRQPTPRIVAMSGGGLCLDASYCLELAVAFGAVVSLMKPFTFEQLLHAVESPAPFGGHQPEPRGSRPGVAA